MGSTHTFVCRKCGKTTSTSGPWEYYRDKASRRRNYGHPLPISETAEKRGCCGLWAELYCKKCKKTFKVILFETRRRNVDIWDEWERIKIDQVKCPKCGRKNMVLEMQKGDKVICPRCNDFNCGIYMGGIS